VDGTQATGDEGRLAGQREDPEEARVEDLREPPERRRETAILGAPLQTEGDLGDRGGGEQERFPGQRRPARGLEERPVRM
jgi:hypothetical protein